MSAPSSPAASSTSSGSSTSSEESNSDFVTLRDPVPGFAIKTYIVEAEGHEAELPAGLKVFINVCSHKLIPAPAHKFSPEIQEQLNKGGEWIVPVVVSIGRENKDKSGKRCWVWDCCINPQVLRDAITHRQVKTILIQTCLNLVEEREDIVLSRQFALPKLTAKGHLEETKVPKAMLAQQPPASVKEEEGTGEDFFSNKTTISNILQQQHVQDERAQEIMSDIISSPPEKKPKKLLIQEIASSPVPTLTYKVEPHTPFSLFTVSGCSKDYAQSASISYLPWSHEIFLQSSVSTNTLLMSIPENSIPKSLEAFYNDSSSCLRVVVK